MGRIAILSKTVADQIAAGEVVDRPASVVKELVENALDAGAASVTVELEDGGRSLIRVSDDGSGMERGDALLAVERHATSKIRTSADLVGVATYGFRGEALSAIASVSRFELETANGERDGGTRVRVAGGRVDGVDAAARARGTGIAVRQLFYNTPARRKFLRSARSETRAVHEAVTVLALARLDVHFRLISDGRVLLDAPPVAAVADRIALLFGPDLASQLVPLESLTGPVTVRGFVQRPAAARPSGRKAYLFVNGRPFRDPFLIRAAEAGYRATVPAGIRPSLFLSIGVAGDAIDVNVHPAKLEVRFRDRMLVERSVEEAVRKALGTGDAAAGFGRFGGSAVGRFEGSSAFTNRPPAEPPLAGVPSTAGRSLFDEHQPGRPSAAPWAGPTDILQLFHTYLLFETPEGMVVVDQHSAHERVLYERTMEDLASGAVAAQRLLLPLTLELSGGELDAVEQHRESLTRIGFEVEPFGGRSVVLHAVPNPHPRFDARRCFEELVADLSRSRDADGHNRLERFAATFACKAAIKAGHALTDMEMRDLLARLFACELPPHDVHGRPTIVRMTREELERRFGRA